MTDYVKALEYEFYGKNWTIGETYESLEWRETDIPKPSRAKLDANYILYKAENDYKLNRKLEYPAIEEQLDYMYHYGLDAWKEKIKIIKEKYPKPE